MGDDNEDGRMSHETEGDDEERRLFWMAAAIPHGSSWSLAGSLDGVSRGYWDGVSRSLRTFAPSTRLPKKLMVDWLNWLAGGDEDEWRKISKVLGLRDTWAGGLLLGVPM